MYNKTNSPLTDETLATMALSGVRELCQGGASPLTTAAASYTVTDPNCRRVICFHLGAGTPGAGDIRFRLNATATTDHMPLLPQRYVVVYATQDETISFFNASADTIKVYCMEIC